MVAQVWNDTFGKLESFTQELERVKSYVALSELKPLWRIMKSIQLRYLPVLDEDLSRRLEKMIEKLEIQDVTPTAYSEDAARTMLGNLGYSCSIDPDSFDEEDR
ncbi:hypothetical protein PA10_00228 [Pseudomonas phage pPa_SNUABM_DT01]|nr:hypothetical protein PA10_00228 [Pseudomonas phage pPa_SNUABM_DT01]